MPLDHFPHSSTQFYVCTPRERLTAKYNFVLSHALHASIIRFGRFPEERYGAAKGMSLRLTATTATLATALAPHGSPGTSNTRVQTSSPRRREAGSCAIAVAQSRHSWRTSRRLPCPVSDGISMKRAAPSVVESQLPARAREPSTNGPRALGRKPHG